MTVIVGGFLNR